MRFTFPRIRSFYQLLLAMFGHIRGWFDLTDASGNTITTEGGDQIRVTQMEKPGSPGGDDAP